MPGVTLCPMNAKGDLIARALSLGLGTPTFEAQASGPAHERHFAVRIWAGGEVLGSGEGRSKREAERLAAERALRRLNGEEAEGEAGEGASGGAGGEETERPPGDEGWTPEPVGELEPRQPWPIYAGVLAQAVEAALQCAPEDATLSEIRRDAAGFYRELLRDLGHGPEELSTARELGGAGEG